MKIKTFFVRLSFATLVLLATQGFAHPMPYSVLLLDIKKTGIEAELQMPLKELQVVFPDEDLDKNYQTLLQRKSQWLDEYLLQHFTINDSVGHKWKISIQKKSVKIDAQNLTGKYHELIFKLWLETPKGSSPRHFIMHYDAIMHQLITHKLWIKVQRDFYGNASNDSTKADLGILGVNFSDNTVSPVVINLDEGSRWNGFKKMVLLGIEHIKEGTDHLLFLFVLLLPATLIVEKKRWEKFGGTKYSLLRLFKIATAFTIGHSISLLLGAMKLLILPQQPVEIAIAVTIFITAIHALRPIFPNKEIFIATGFGLIHGLAFATVLTELNLHGEEMAISILGFNIGIELMQLFVILITVPWLIILSEHKLYKWIRVVGAIFCIIASLAWIAERISMKSNVVSIAVQSIAEHGQWIVLILALIALLNLYLLDKKEIKAIVN